MSDDDSNNRGIFDIIDKGIDLYERNKDLIKDAAPDGVSNSDIEGNPAKRVDIGSSYAEIVMDVGTDSVDNIGLDFNDGNVEVTVGNEKVKASVPDDVIMDDAEAYLNNGIIEVKIPRDKEE